MKNITKNEKEILRSIIYAKCIEESLTNEEVVNVEETAVATTDAAMYLVQKMDTDNPKYSAYDVMKMMNNLPDAITNELMNIYMSHFNMNVLDSINESEITFYEMRVFIVSIISRIGNAKNNEKIIDPSFSIEEMVDLCLEAVRAMRPSCWDK